MRTETLESLDSQHPNRKGRGSTLSPAELFYPVTLHLRRKTLRKKLCSCFDLVFGPRGSDPVGAELVSALGKGRNLWIR